MAFTCFQSMFSVHLNSYLWDQLYLRPIDVAKVCAKCQALLRPKGLSAAQGWAAVATSLIAGKMIELNRGDISGALMLRKHGTYDIWNHQNLEIGSSLYCNVGLAKISAERTIPWKFIEFVCPNIPDIWVCLSILGAPKSNAVEDPSITIATLGWWRIMLRLIQKSVVDWWIPINSLLA